MDKTTGLNASSARRRAKFISNYVKEILPLITQAGLNPELLSQVRIRIDDLDTKVPLFDQCIDILNSEGNDKEDLEQEAYVMYSTFHNLVASIREKYSILTGTQPSTNASAQLSSSTFQSSSQSQFIRLPKLELPKFDGTFTKWQTFIDLFISTVHDNESLKPIQKFQYLKTSLTGPALKAIENLATTDANYDIAFETLKNKYARTRLITSSHILSLVNLAPMKSSSYNHVQQFVSTIREHVDALKALRQPVENWDEFIAVTLISKLETHVRNKFEATLDTQELPKLTSLINYLNSFTAAQEWQTITPQPNQVYSPTKVRLTKPNQHKRSFVTVNTDSALNSTENNKPVSSSTNQFKPNPFCVVCRKPHLMYSCEKFKSLPLTDRRNVIRKHHHCYNCLSSGHQVNSCKSVRSCKTCNRRHHTLLHQDPHVGPASVELQASNDTNPITNAPTNLSVVMTSASAVAHQRLSTTVLLSTAIVYLTDNKGTCIQARALLDPGSEVSLITDSCRRRLNTTIQPINATISGVANQPVPVIKGTINCGLHTRAGIKISNVDFAILPKITNQLPHHVIQPDMFPNLNQWNLADPHFNVPGPIDLLLGADIYFSLVTGNQHQIGNGPYLVETKLGWVVTGRIPSPAPRQRQVLLITNSELSSILHKFWEIEEIENIPIMTEDERLAETLFTKYHTRTSEGRYIVPLLFKKYPPDLGKSYGAALSCYRSLRKRLLADNTLRQNYFEFMKDYLESGHMCMQQHAVDIIQDGYFIPHHAVHKPDSPSTKLRVVFNGSKPTSNGISLNASLLPGPALQNDVTKILLRLRLHKFMITADIRQMYRQFRVIPEQCKYQQILWDFDLSNQPQIYQLLTVTYGLSSAPYLALRTLKQLVIDEGEQFPEASQAINEDTFVDDIISGRDTIEAAQELKRQLIALMSKAKLELRKWSSNCTQLLADLPPEHIQIPASHMLNPDDTVNVLGLIFNPTSDTFAYKINLTASTFTKRQLLSEAARIFDPLGWLSPITIVAKQLIQNLWKSGIGWDEDIPTSTADHWYQHKLQLGCISSVQIPRWIPTSSQVVDVIGCCDASERSYAAAVYLRTECEDGTKVFLIIAKTKVAPVKQISLPRLELCAAVLLANLTDFISKTLPIQPRRTFLFSDSSITLSWIRSSCQRWKTFVANRVGQIQTLTNVTDWYHISTHHNPADCSSRGISPNELLHHPLWWTGPDWFALPTDNWPIKDNLNHIEDDVLNEESRPAACLIIHELPPNPILDRFSSLVSLIRTTSYIVRFMHNCRNPHSKQTGPLTATELESALLRWVAIAQDVSFGEDIKQLKNNKLCKPQLQKLCPFLDDAMLLRVGGRLKHAQIHYNSKHPLLLPASHRITELIVRQYHQRYLHPSPKTLQAILSTKFWILSARRLIRSITAKCTKCFRCNPRNEHPLMGNLPEWRVRPLKPFSVVGIDYGGPFSVTPYKGRGFISLKSYLCLFICFSTRAVHLELASDLSTDAFLAAFRRFLARRGRCSRITSDSGTNFIGARRYFTELQKFVTSTKYNEFLMNKLAEEGIEWNLNPPSGPHFGELYEAAIKSVKFHLSRIIGSQILTYEEFNTVLCQIESILNSRPLGPLSNDPNDLQPLTPNHILTLEAAVNLPERNLLDVPENRLSRWQLIQKIVQDFWKRWHLEYLNTLQCRTKWTKPATPLEVGTLVLIKDDGLPPLQWKMGRVTRVHPGKDKIIRVADVRTATSTLTRPVVKLYPLPIDPLPIDPVPIDN